MTTRSEPDPVRLPDHGQPRGPEPRPGSPPLGASLAASLATPLAAAPLAGRPPAVLSAAAARASGADPRDDAQPGLDLRRGAPGLAGSGPWAPDRPTPGPERRGGLSRLGPCQGVPARAAPMQGAPGPFLGPFPGPSPGLSQTGPAPVGPGGRSPLMRKVEFAVLLPSGGIGEGARPVPAIPAFEEAFAAFARGTLFAASRGLVAVEDLWPGDEVRVAGGAMRRLLWRGSTTVVPAGGSARVDPAMGRLTRVSADALGIARPMQDLVLGPHAQLVQRGPAVRALTGGEAALLPAAHLIDGVNVVAVTPASPVQVFHLGFERHERLEAHGVEVGSQHPAGLAAPGLPPDLLGLWLSCFPHRRSLAEWGPATLPRVTGLDLGLFDAA